MGRLEICEPGRGRNIRMSKEKIQSNISKIAYGCFYLAVIIEVIIVLIDKSAYINPIEGSLFRLTFLLCLIKAVLTRYSLKEYLVMVLFLGLSMFTYFVTGRDEAVRIIVFVIACKDIDIKKCLKLVFYITLIGTLLIVILSMFGVGGAIAHTQYYGREGTTVETRYSFGMGHPNALHCMIWSLSVLYLYLYGATAKWQGYLAVAAINLFSFILTDSKTGLLVSVFSVLYATIYRFVKTEWVKKICSLAGIIVTAGCIGISVYFANQAYHVYNYDWSIDRGPIPTFLKKVDSMLTGRLRELVGTTRWEGTTQTWSLFSAPENNYFFDLGWVRMFYWYGIIPACIFIGVLFAVMIFCYRKRYYMAMMLMVSFAVYTVVEAHAVSVYLARNYVLFLIGGCWSTMLCGEKNEE